MIVVDASVVANAVGDDGTAGRAARSRLIVGETSAPDFADIETVAVLRKMWLLGTLSERRFRTAVEDLAMLPIVRFPAGPLMLRAYELRAKITPYDAAYVALAEALDCPLLTADARLARAPGIRCSVEVLTD